MNAVIIEDEEDAIVLLQTLVTECLPQLTILGHASDVETAIRLIDESKPDLIFLDINLKNGNGFQVIDGISYGNAQVIFTTAYDAYALKAFNYNAIDYLLKPYSPQQLIHAVQKAEKMAKSLKEEDINFLDKMKSLVAQMNNISKGKIPFHTQEGIHIYHIDDIIRLEVDRSYCRLYLTKDRKMIVSKTLKNIEEILPEESFKRVHKSHLININFLSSYIKDEGGYLQMKNGDNVPLSRRKKEGFLSYLEKLR